VTAHLLILGPTGDARVNPSALPESAHPGAKKALAEIWTAEEPK
jgi:hypothetical protein